MDRIYPPSEFTNALDDWCTCGHMRGEHLGSYTTHDDGPCNSRGAKYAGQQVKLDQVRGSRSTLKADFCDCVGFKSVDEELTAELQKDNKNAGLGTQAART